MYGSVCVEIMCVCVYVGAYVCVSVYKSVYVCVRMCVFGRRCVCVRVHVGEYVYM